MSRYRTVPIGVRRRSKSIHRRRATRSDRVRFARSSFGTGRAQTARLRCEDREACSTGATRVAPRLNEAVDATQFVGIIALMGRQLPPPVCLGESPFQPMGASGAEEVDLNGHFV